MKVSLATLDDWLDIKALVERLRASKFSPILGTDLGGMEGFLISSRTHPQNVGVLLLRWDGNLIGLCCMMAIDAPSPGLGVGSNGTVQTQRHGFIHSVYIEPWGKQRTPAAAGELLMRGIELWARERRAVWLYGNVRLDGRFGALWRKFGLQPQHGVAGKSVSPQMDELPGLELHQVVVGKELTHG